MHRPRVSFRPAFVALLLGAMLLFQGTPPARGEAMLQLFNVNWDELIAKMPEIAEAGYTSLWLPPPAKAGSVYSVGYDQFDPFDLGDKNQRSTIRTRYGTKAELQQVVEMAHRFGLRVYFDNIMNHRGFDIPGFNASTPTNLYPGMVPGDFHLARNGSSYYTNWANIANWGIIWDVQHLPLFGLVDIANENGSVNENFGNSLGSTITKPSFIRHPGSNSYYMDTNLPAIAGPWRPFNGTNGDPVAEDVNAYLIRAALWTMSETKCDGFRFDAVKHVPDTFFGDPSATPYGYVGAIQTMYDYVHGYGSNVTGNGFIEGDDNRNSCFDSEAVRNDALLFGEHLGEPPGFTGYIDRGMRLLGSPLHYYLNNTLGVGSLDGLQYRDPSATPFSPINSVLFAQSHDDAVATHRELHNGYNFFHEGIPAIYSDGYNQSVAPDYFPKVASAPYLGEFGDNKMPEVAFLHHQLARGGTRPRWGDADICAFERYDYREGGSAADQTVVLFAMNDNYSAQGDTAFVDGEGESFPSGVNKPPGAGTDAQGLAVSFPPGSVLAQLAMSAPGYDRTYKKVTVRPATNTRSVANGSVGATVYVGSQTIPAGGGAIEILVPSGGYVAYGYQWPEASRAALKDAITLRQNGADAARITVFRKDGINGDTNFNPIFPFKMRGSINPDGTVAGGVNVSNKTYAITVPIVTNALFDILVRSDASTVNTLLKLDGGIDLNSQMNLGSTNADKRDNWPGAVTDVFLGYEQSVFRARSGPEKFAAKVIDRNNVTSAGAETYYYTVGATNLVSINGASNAAGINASTATWVYHDPAAPGTATNNATATQRVPLSPTNGQPVDLWVKVGYQFQINKCFIYYTTDGSNPEGASGVGTGTTKTVEAFWVAADNADGTIDWWKGTIPASNQVASVQVRYKIALYKDNIGEITDADSSKLYGLNLAGITNFNPTTATVWLHADRNTNSTITGLQEGFHILRARCFLPRTNKSSVFNTFAQTFYYDAAPPGAVFAAPATNVTALSNTSYQVIIRADSTATGIEYNISDSDPANDDSFTGQNNGNGTNIFGPKFVALAPGTPTTSLNTTYSNYPVEFRFTYANIPTNGSATFTVRVKEATTAVLSNRLTQLTRTLATAAPGQFVRISDPAMDGLTLPLQTNDVFTINTCFSQALAGPGNIDYFSIYVNGQLLPRRDAFNSPLYIINPSDTNCGPGLRLLSCDWTGAAAGTNIIQVFYTNGVVLSDTRVVTVAPPVDYALDSDGDGVPDWQELIAGTDSHDSNSVLRITGLADGNQRVNWDSIPGVNYQVLGTTNFAQPLFIISPVIQASGSNATYLDSAPDPTNKFYRIQVVP